jgi:hypothetical protein
MCYERIKMRLHAMPVAQQTGILNKRRISSWSMDVIRMAIKHSYLRHPSQHPLSQEA